MFNNIIYRFHTILPKQDKKMELIKCRNLQMFSYLPIKIAEPEISGYQPVS
jgi:hypothetical protein